MRLLVVFLCASVIASSALSDVHLRLWLTPGSLTVAGHSVRLEQGQAQTVRLTVQDGRGTGAGWTLTFAEIRPAHARPVRIVSARIVSVTAHCASGSTCTLPRFRQRAGNVLVAKALTGMGRMRLLARIIADVSGRGRFLISSR